MTVQKPRRQRGVVLTYQGWQRLEAARRELIPQDSGSRYTFEALSEQTGLDARTVARVVDRREGVDKRTLEQFFKTFNLKLDTSDYTKFVLNAEVGQSDTASSCQDLRSCVDVSIFYGRTTELAQLETWSIQERCRLIAVLGMGGIGKTALSVKLAEQVDLQFEYVIWRSLLHAPPIATVIADLVQFLSNRQVTENDLPDSIDGKISQLITYLQDHRCLLVLDNADSTLRAGDRAGAYRPGYEGYGDLLRRVGETAHRSCLVLTSREKPREVALLEGETLPVRSLKLGGLQEIEGQEIFRAKGLTTEIGSEFKVLFNCYGGNPLALKIVATTIQDLFDGVISEFLQQGTAVFGDIRDLLSQQFERLSDLEKELMYWLAINREPMTIAKLREDIISPVQQHRLLEALESLGRRSLLERSAALFTLQPVVMEYVTSRLVEQVCEEIVSQKPVIFRSHALLKPREKDYIRNTQVRLILKPVIDGLLTGLRSQRNIESCLAQILAKLQQESPLELGYTGGNALNLLSQMQTDLSHRDFSFLTIWQADLRGVNLHNANFQNANLAKSVFAETFGAILSVAFSSDGKLLATADDTTSEIRLYQVRSGRQLFNYRGHTGWVWSVAFSPTDNLLASGGTDCVVRLWDIRTGQCLKTLHGHSHRIGCVAFSPDGRILTSSSDDRTVRLWDVNTGECLRTLQVQTDRIQTVAFNPRSNHLASSSDHYTVKLWDISTGECLRTLTGHTDWVWSVAFSPDGRLLASGSVDQTVRLWDVSTGECLDILREHTDKVRSVTFSQGHTLISGSEDQTMRFWNLQTGKCFMSLHGHSKGVWSIALSPDGQTLASGSDDQSVRLWDVNTGRAWRTLQGYSNRVWSIAFSPDGRMLASGTEDQLVRLWDISAGQCSRTLKGHSDWVWLVAFSPDGQTLVSGSKDQTVRLWDVDTNQCSKILHIQGGNTDWLWIIALSPDSRILATESDDHSIKLWDISSGQCLRTLQGHTNRIRSIAFDFQATKLVSGSQDETIKLWDVSTGECLRTLWGHTDCVWSVAYAPRAGSANSLDGRLIASGGTDRTLRLWNADTGEYIKTLLGHTSWVVSVAISPDGNMLASGSVDQTIKLWDISTGQCLKTLQGHTNWVRLVTFSPDGQTLASGSEDETVMLWNVQTGECLKTLRSSRPYEGMNITGVAGITDATIAALKALGAVEQEERESPIAAQPNVG